MYKIKHQLKMLLTSGDEWSELLWVLRHVFWQLPQPVENTQGSNWKKIITNNFDNCLKHFSQVKVQNICWFQLLLCKDLMFSLFLFFFTFCNFTFETIKKKNFILKILKILKIIISWLPKNKKFCLIISSTNSFSMDFT